MGDPTVKQPSNADLLRMQKDAGLPNLPTAFTYEMRNAVALQGPRASEWADKPHRIVYDLCTHIEQSRGGGSVGGISRATLVEKIYDARWDTHHMTTRHIPFDQARPEVKEYCQGIADAVVRLLGLSLV